MRRHKFIIPTVALLCIAAIAVWHTATHKSANYISINHSPTISELDISIGADTAPLTMIMYVSFNCRHCRSFLQSDLPQLRQRYINNGLLRLVLKPIDIAENQDMMSALRLAVCMNHNGDCSEIMELLLSETAAVYTDEFRQLIDDIIDQNPHLAECLTTTSYNYVEQNNMDFNSMNQKLTPIFVVDNHLYRGRYPIEKFCQIIDNELINK